MLLTWVKSGVPFAKYVKINVLVSFCQKKKIVIDSLYNYFVFEIIDNMKKIAVLVFPHKSSIANTHWSPNNINYSILNINKNKVEENYYV